MASGPNAASPHHEPTGRTMLPRDAVVLDFGGELAGYYSDTSRTVVVGEPPAGFEAVFEIVHEAQEAAFRAVAPGVAAQDIDRVARGIIEDAGYGARFVHRTGHGIGLEVHEPPYLVEGSDWVLRAGHDVLDRAGDLPGGAVRGPDRGHRGGDRDRGRAPEPLHPRSPGGVVTRSSRRVAPPAFHR